MHIYASTLASYLNFHASPKTPIVVSVARYGFPENKKELSTTPPRVRRPTLAAGVSSPRPTACNNRPRRGKTRDIVQRRPTAPSSLCHSDDSHICLRHRLDGVSSRPVSAIPIPIPTVPVARCRYIRPPTDNLFLDPPRREGRHLRSSPLARPPRRRARSTLASRLFLGSTTPPSTKPTARRGTRPGNGGRFQSRDNSHNNNNSSSKQRHGERKASHVSRLRWPCLFGQG